MASISKVVESHRPDLTPFQQLYKHFHQNPELSDMEKETAATVVAQLKETCPDFKISQNIGGHGVAAVFANGDGPTVLLRADFDALPVEELTGLDYASKKRMKDSNGIEKPVGHACGHDMHTTSLLGAAKLMSSAKENWSGTLILAFQPAEERGTGAKAMVDDGLYDPKRHAVPIPDVVMGGHVVPYRTGVVVTRRGLMMNSADSLRITMHGRGAHASMPNQSIDPVVMAASTIMKLQTIVSREVQPGVASVVTIGSIQAGDAENVIAHEAKLAVNIRSSDQNTRDRTLASIKRIVNAESVGSNAPKDPTFETSSSFPLTINDDQVTAKIEESFSAHFGESPQTYSRNTTPLSASEDYSILGSSINKPCCYWFYGGADPEVWDKAEKSGTLQDLPVNHSALFAPVIMPTLKNGLDAYAVAALTWLLKK